MDLQFGLFLKASKYNGRSIEGNIKKQSEYVSAYLSYFRAVVLLHMIPFIY